MRIGMHCQSFGRKLRTMKQDADCADLPTEDFVHCGNELISWIAQYLEDMRQIPVTPASHPGDLRKQLPTNAPEHGESMRAIVDDFQRIILPHVTHWNHPGFHGYFSTSASAAGILGELLTAALNTNAMLWKSCPAATELEQVTTAWLLEWLHLPSSWFGMILDSASSGALHAIVAARQRAVPTCRQTGRADGLVVYVSRETHSSIEKAAMTVGIGQNQVRHIGTDEKNRMRSDLLEAAIAEDRAAGRVPFFAAATVGTTSTTAVDPVRGIAGICRKHGVWLHVDGAYGGAACLVPECRHLMDGVELADSFILNAHKWLMVPLDCSIFYTAHPEVLRAAFSFSADYLQTDDTAEVNYMDYGVALGRRFRALKLWFVMRFFGREGMTSILQEHVRLAKWLGAQVAADARLELMAEVTLGLVCFRAKDGDTATHALMERINASRRFFVTGTKVNGKLAIRVAIGNIRTNEIDVRLLWETIPPTSPPSGKNCIQ